MQKHERHEKQLNCEFCDQKIFYSSYNQHLLDDHPKEAPEEAKP
jgi:hypothetical protein